MAKRPVIRDSDDEGDESDSSLLSVGEHGRGHTGSFGSINSRVTRVASRESTTKSEVSNTILYDPTVGAHEQSLLVNVALPFENDEVWMPPSKRRKTASDIEFHNIQWGGQEAGENSVLGQPNDRRLSASPSEKIGHNFAQTSTFPLQSSTVPDNIWTQQRLLEEAKSWKKENDCNADILVPLDHDGESSIPWSQYISMSHPDGSGESKSHSRSDLVHEDSDAELNDKCSVERSIIYDPNKNHKVDVIPTQRLADGDDIIPSPGGPDDHTTTEESLQHDMEAEVNAGSGKHPSDALMRNDKATRDLKDDSDDELASEPRNDVYKPKPSRSRSARVISVFKDTSSLSGEEFKGRPRRNRTTDALSDMSDMPSSKHVEILCSMGFTPKRSKVALLENRSHVNRAVDWLFDNASLFDVSPRKSTSSDIEEDQDGTETSNNIQRLNESAEEPEVNIKVPELTIETDKSSRAIPENINKDHSKPLKFVAGLDNEPRIPRRKQPPKSKRSKTVPVVIEVSDSDDEDNFDPIVVEPPKTKRKRGRPPKVNADVGVGTSDSKTEDDTDAKDGGSAGNDRLDDGLETSGNLLHLNGQSLIEALDTSRIQQKRGRGRPRKNLEAVMQTSIADESATGDTGDQPKRPLVPPHKDATSDDETPSKLHSRSSVATPHQSRARTPPRPSLAEETTSPMPKATNSPAATPPPKTALSTGSSHSPINKGKVPYRVGLSKRARIAPLLRVVKK